MDFIIYTASSIYILAIIIVWLGETIFTSLQSNNWFSQIKKCVDPLINLLQKNLPKLGKIDLSYLAAIIFVRILSKILIWFF